MQAIDVTREARESCLPRVVRPGFVAGASANDPTTVGTLAVVGATTGYGLAWLVLAILPMLAVTQIIAAGIGAATGGSVQAAIVRRYGMAWGLIALVAIVVVNLFTLIADVNAGSAALAMLLPVPYQLLVVPFLAVVCFVLLRHSYARVATYLMFLPMLFVAYGLSAVMAHVNWIDVFRHIVVPQIAWNGVAVAGAIALIGTTITSYEYVWESIEVSESARGIAALPSLNRDALLGVIAAGAGFLFVLVASAATIGAKGLPIETPADAARALEPLAGPWAGYLFGLGLFGSAALTVPILASTTAYAVSHTFGWNGSLNASVGEAKAFYATLIASLIVAGLGSFTGVGSIRLLYWASIAGGVCAPVTLVLMNAVARSRSSAGVRPIGVRLSIAGWCVTAVVTLACIAFLMWAFKS